MEEELCFIVYGKYDISSQTIQMNIGFVPYCEDLESNQYDPQEDESLYVILKRLLPDEVTFEYYINLIDARNDEMAVNSFNRICLKIENIVLPYIKKLDDLEFLYEELIMLKKTLALKSGANSDNESIHLNDSKIFALSLKLHKFENSLIYIDNKAIGINNHISYANSRLSNIMNGDIDEATLIVQKKIPDIIEKQKRAAQEAILQWGIKLSSLEILRNAVLENNCIYIDNYVREIEDRSRNYLRRMINGK